MKQGEEAALTYPEAEATARRLAMSDDQTQGEFFSEFFEALILYCGDNDPDMQMAYCSDYISVSNEAKFRDLFVNLGERVYE